MVTLLHDSTISSGKSSTRKAPQSRHAAHGLPAERLVAASRGFFPAAKILYEAGSTTSVRRVLLTKPPMSTVASNLRTSAPVPLASAMGTPVNPSSAYLTELKALNSSRKMREKQRGVTAGTGIHMGARPVSRGGGRGVPALLSAAHPLTGAGDAGCRSHARGGEGLRAAPARSSRDEFSMMAMSGKLCAAAPQTGGSRPRAASAMPITL
jgi:hypothetical protein